MKAPPNDLAAWARRNRKPYGSTRAAADEARRRGISLTRSDLKDAEATGCIAGPKLAAFEALYGPLPVPTTGEPASQPADGGAAQPGRVGDLAELIGALEAQTAAMRNLTDTLERLLTVPELPAEAPEAAADVVRR